MKGKQLKNMLNRINDMQIIPCYIQIFELYTICKQWRKMRWEKKLEEYEGFLSYAYMFWYKAISKHIAIGKNVKPYIK